MTGKLVEWGHLDFVSNVDIEYNNARKGSVVEADKPRMVDDS